MITRQEVIENLVKLLDILELENKGYVDQLLQLFNGVIWDGNLIDKPARDALRKNGLCDTANGGWNFITRKGIEYLTELCLVKPYE